MGVLNVTPDSFSDGGQFAAPEQAVARADRMIAEGADIIDVGAESTRPGSDPVGPAEQIARAVAVIRAVHERHPGVLISIDTRSAAVAVAALEAGAGLVNDVSALRDDPALAEVVASRGVPVALMHMRGRPKTMQSADGGPTYGDVVTEVIEFLRQRIDWAVQHGISRERIMVDPGLGFGKTVEHNLELLRGLRAFEALGVPVLVGASRKSFVGAVTGVEVPHERLAGSLACVVAAVWGGAAIVRVHDVAESRQAVAMAQALRTW